MVGRATPANNRVMQRIHPPFSTGVWMAVESLDQSTLRITPISFPWMFTLS